MPPIARVLWVPPLAALGLLAAACASAPAERSVEAAVAESLRQRQIDPQDILLPNRLSDDMRAWARQQVRETDPSTTRLAQLLRALQDPSRLGLQYEGGFTGTAEDVFRNRRYNCLSFTHLFVAMAREIGVRAYYLRVDQIRRFDKEGDLVVVSGHITAGFGEGAHREVLEFNVGPAANYRSARPIPDLLAVAMFYSNRGAELMRRGDVAAAAEWLRTAVALDPEYADAWVNFGVARRRTGDLEGAERAYRRAVELEPQSFPAYHNLATLFRLRGDRNAARELLRLLDRRSNRDPYIYLTLGDDSLELGNLDEAERFYRRALRLSTEARPEARAAMGQWALASGAIEEARLWLRKAEDLDATNNRVVRLAEQLEALPGEG